MSITSEIFPAKNGRRDDGVYGAPILSNLELMMDQSIMPVTTNNLYLDRETELTLIQETILPAGTKQRGLDFFLNLALTGTTALVTYGTAHGYGQVATAACCAAAGLACTIYLAKVTPRTAMTEQAIKYGANVVEISDPDQSPRNSAQNRSVKWISNKVLRELTLKHVRSHPSAYFLELGLDDIGYIGALAAALKVATTNIRIRPRRLWIAGGSGVLTRALAQVWPATQFLVVQVGRTLYRDDFPNIDVTIFIAPGAFPAPTRILPPYISLAHYDAKVWSFVQQYGKDGDFIWNVK